MYSMIIKSFKIFESLSNIESITSEEISSVREIFYDLVDSGDALEITTKLFSEMSFRQFDALREFELWNILSKYSKSVAKDLKEFVNLATNNALSVKISVPSFSDYVNEKISDLIKRSMLYTNLDIGSISTNYKTSDERGEFAYIVVFLKNTEEITRMSKELL